MALSWGSEEESGGRLVLRRGSRLRWRKRAIMKMFKVVMGWLGFVFHRTLGNALVDNMDGTLFQRIN